VSIDSVQSVQSSSIWVVPITAAIIAAAATLIAAYIGYTKDRRDQRAQILHDLDIAEKLPEGSRAKNILISYAEKRALLLPIESHVRHIALDEMLDFALFLTVIAIGIAVPVSGGEYWRYISTLAVAFILFGLRWRTYRRRTKNLTEQYLKEQNLAPEMFESISAMIWRSYRPWLIWNIFSRNKSSPALPQGKGD
jgi:Flp pilus assembly protein TadB